MRDNVSTELRLSMLEGRMHAQEVVLQCLCKAIATIDGRSGRAVALALEVAELEQAEITGEDDEVVRLLRRFREQFGELQLERLGHR